MRIDPLARLTCGHFRRVTQHQAHMFEFVHCPTCNKYEQPQTVFLREWYVWCESEGCTWSRWVGQERRRADSAKHLHMKRGRYSHVVRMEYAIVPGMEYAVAIANGAEQVTAFTTEEHHEPEQPDLFAG